VFSGIILKIVSTLCFTLMAAGVKWVGMSRAPGELLPVGQVVFSRSFFALIPVLIWIVLTVPLRQAISTARISGHIKRSLFGTCGMFFGFAALALLPLADATVIGYGAPLFVVVMAAFILKETVRIYRWSAVGIGFLGVVVAMAPHLAIFGGETVSFYGALLAFSGAIMAAFAMIEVRRLTATETTSAIVFYFSIFSSLAGAATFLLGWFIPSLAWDWPSLEETGKLIFIGIMGGLGQITLTAAYRRADTSVIAPFEYVSIVWAMTIGYVFFDHAPENAVLAGSAIVVAAGLFVIYRENQLGLERKRQMEASSLRPL
jgi:drug/metabolite transporter (DMT)-like permease